MAAPEEARVAEINALLQKRGMDQIRGPERTALVTELDGLLRGDDGTPAPYAPEKLARAEEIGRRLRDHAAGKPDAHLDLFERNTLAREQSDILLGDGVDEGAAQ